MTKKAPDPFFYLFLQTYMNIPRRNGKYPVRNENSEEVLSNFVDFCEFLCIFEPQRHEGTKKQS